MNYYIVATEKRKNEVTMQLENKNDERTVKRLQRYMELLGGAGCPKQRD